MKITLPSSKIDKHSLSSMSKHSHETDSIPRGNKSRTTPVPSVKVLKLTQDEYDLDKHDKVSSSVEGTRQTSVRVSPHPLLNTPPKFDNKRDYKGDTHDETPDSSKKYTNFKKRIMLVKKGTLIKKQRLLTMMNILTTNR